MIRLAGSVFLIVCGWLGGHTVAQKQKERQRQCMLLESSLNNLRAELEYTHAPFEQIARNLAENPIFQNFPFARFCGQNTLGYPFFLLFRDGIGQNQKLFGSEICGCLELLSGQLGNYPVENQAAAIELCRLRVAQITDALRGKTAQNAKLYHSLGLLGGAAVVILLW